MSALQQGRTTRRAVLAGLGALGLAACTSGGRGEPTSAPSASASGAGSAVPSSPAPSPTVSPATVSPSASTTTAAPAYPGLGIEALRQERWGADGEIETVRELAGQEGFRRFEIRYRSDGIPIAGFMNVPAGAGPFPVVIVCHGFTEPASYELLDYVTEHADALARAGFLVLHPAYRNHRGSGDGPNDYRIGYSRDVLHLTALARKLPQGNGRPVGLWGHSMGGGPVLRALAVMPGEVGAAVVYGSVSANETTNWDSLVARRRASGLSGPPPEPSSPTDDPALYAAISPGNFFDGLRVPVQIHHGGNDEQVRLENAYELDAQLSSLGTPHELFVYPGQLHNLGGAALATATQRWVDLFGRTLR